MRRYQSVDSRSSSHGEPLLKPFNSPQIDSPVPTSRSPQCRPLSIEPDTPVVEHPDGIDVRKSYLPLTLRCTICLRTSTWYNPMYQKFEQNPPLDVLPSLSNPPLDVLPSLSNPPLDVLPSLSISSHSTSSEPSSIGTEFFSSDLMPPSTDSIGHVSSSLEDTLVNSDGSDDSTPVVLSCKSIVSDPQASYRSKSWTGGGLEGVCSNCHSLNQNHMVLNRSHLSQSMRILSEPHSGKSNPLLSCSQIQSCHGNACSVFTEKYSHAQVIANPIDAQPFQLEVRCPTGGIASTLPKHPSALSTKLTKTGVNSPVLTETELRCSRSNYIKSAIPSSKIGVHPQERPIIPCHVPVLPNLPLKSNLSEPECMKRSQTITMREKSPSSKCNDIHTAEISSGLTTKRDVVSTDSGDSLRQEMNQRNNNLRNLLREAKIPQPDSDDLVNSNRRHPTTLDKWQAAMIATPRDHLRLGDVPAWQLYGASDSPFYGPPYGLSVSTSSLSGKETLLSTSATSLRDNLVGDSRSCSPVSDKRLRNQTAPLGRRPATTDTLHKQPSSKIPPPLSDASRYQSIPFPSEPQEILSGSTLTKPRQPPSNISLIARLTNIHPSASKIGRSFGRRPYTATGTTQSSPIAQSSPKPGPHGRGTPCPNISAPSTLIPSLFLAGSKATAPGSRVASRSAPKRPATATGSVSRPGLSPLSTNDSLITRQLSVQNLAINKNSTTYVPPLPPIQGRAGRNQISDFTDDAQHRSVSLRVEFEELRPKNKKKNNFFNF